MRLLALVGVVAGCARAMGGGDAGGPDADPGAFAHCAPPAPAPAWAEPGAASVRVACPDVAIAVDALAGGAVRLVYGDAEPSWTVTAPGPAPAFAIGGADGAVELCTPELAVRVDAACRVRATLADGTVIADDAGFALVTAEGVPAVRLDRRAAPDRVLGLGERTGAADRHGRRLAFWNTDAYDPAHGGWAPDADPLYQSIPFEVRIRGEATWGVFTDAPYRMVMDLAATDAARETTTVFGGPAPRGAGAPSGLTQYLLPGPAMADVVRRYTELTGRTPRPPRWALGYHQSRWGYPDAATVEAVADRFVVEDLPLAAMWLDIQHHDGFRTFTWDASRFGDRSDLTGRLASRGVRTVVIADPGIKVDPGWPVYDGGVAGDHFLREPSGAQYQGVVWPGPAAFPDVTRAATRAWWGEHVAALGADGVAGVWLDVNEPTTFPESGGATVPITLPVDGGGRATTMAEVHNVYALLQAAATQEALATTTRPFVLSRAGYAGIQRHAAVWTGDVPSTFAGLADTLPMLVGLGVSGVPFVGSDIGGYSGHASPELYARWLALGSISPFCRGHVTSGVPGQEPWMFGPSITDLARLHLATRADLLPYLEALFAEAATTGAPVLRPLEWHFPGVVADDQAMLGPSILVAPVVAAGATTRRVVLPPGRWLALPDLSIVEGPAEVDVPAPLGALPLFLREGAIVPRGSAIDLFPGPAPTTFTLVEDDGLTRDGPTRTTTFTLAATATGARVTWSAEGAFAGAPAFTFRVLPIDGAVTAVNAGETAVDHRIADRAVVVTVPASAGALELFYDRALAAPATATVDLVVELPPGTPVAAPIHVAASPAWTHVALTRVSPTRAAGTIRVPRGAWFEYKYTRGDWLTVEKDAACGERVNRARPGGALPVVDRVARWRDACGT
jgi:alpha-glucosidase